jgi:hypothetical protein
MDPLIALKQRRFPWGATRGSEQKMTFLSVVLPFGWATRTATRALSQLWLSALKECRSLGAEPSALVVTSPHYAPLIQQVSAATPTFYYCSDDYSNYSGWDANTMREQESLVVRHARHSFFVSAALRDRAVQEYGIDPARASVSMNATDEEFLSPVPPQEIERLLQRFPKLKRPIAGVIGGINERLDYALLLKVAALKELGTLLLVGPIVNPNDTELAPLLKHPRVLTVGHQPHASLPVWHRALDVALIPYRKSPFNSLCSPLRLFDHLAAGRTIVATTACPQVREFAEHVGLAEQTDQFLEKVTATLQVPFSLSRSELMRACARQQTWRARAVALDARIAAELEERPTVFQSA